MIKIFDVFSTIEVAMGVWFLIIVIIMLGQLELRKSIINVIKKACTIQLLRPFLLILLYLLISILLFKELSVWKWIYLKDIITWFIFAGVPATFKAIYSKAEDHYFRNMVIDNIKLIVLAEFIISTFTFPLLVELLLIPIVIIIVLMQIVASRNEEYHLVNSILSWIISVSGFVILSLAIVNALTVYMYIDLIDLVVSFFIPILFSILFIPVSYCLTLYSRYQILYLKMSCYDSDNWKSRIIHKIKVFSICGVSLNRIKVFKKKYVYRMYKGMREKEFDSLLMEFKNEKN